MPDAAARDPHLPASILPLRTKIVYGLGDWGTSAATTARNLFWLFFLANVVGVDIGIASVVVAVGKLWDAINDPLIGILSDRLQTRWGRRRPFLLFTAVPFGLCFFLMFSVPPIDDLAILAAYYGLIFILFDTLYTLINVPYSALAPALTPDYDERSTLAGWRMGVSIFASLITAAGFKLLAESLFAGWFGGSLAAGYAVSGALWGVTLIIPPLLLFATIREPDAPPATGSANLLRNARDVYANISFRYAAIIYLASFAAVDVVASVFVWFLVFYVRVAAGFDSIILGVMLALALLTMPLVVKLMHRFGKRLTYVGCGLVWIVVLIIISQVPPGGQSTILAAAVFAGLGYGAANAVPWAIVADVIEADELITGQRREGVYFGYLVFLRKLTGTGSILLVGLVLEAAGFMVSAGGLMVKEQPATALLALRLLVSVVPTFCLIVAILTAWRYPLDRQTHLQLRQQLAQRRAALTDAAPHTGKDS